MVLRTYFDKNNTIIKDNSINTGKNPITELYYGMDENGNQTHSRFLFHFDTSTITKHYSAQDTNNLKHVLKMTNTGVFHNDLLNKTYGEDKKRTSSFELMVYELPQDWTEGTGYDYREGSGAHMSHQPSNWKFSKTNQTWPTEGAFGQTPIAVGSQFFSDGNENIEIDITDVVNGYINGTKVNNGLAITYRVDIEIAEAEELQYVGFFTRHTQTFYEPFIETRRKNPIEDDRNEFFMGKDNKLYLYTHKNGVPSDLDGVIAVNIKDHMDVVVGTRLDAVRERKGVYSVTVNIPQDDTLTNQIFFDYWVKVELDEFDVEFETPITDMQFELKDNSEFFKAGYDDVTPKQYKMNIRGVNHNERIKAGDIRKVYVNAVVPYTVNHKEVLDKIEYRIYVKEGNLEHTVIGYEPVERTFQNNYFLLDTASLLPNVYYLDIKFYSNQEARSTKEVIKFEILK